MDDNRRLVYSTDGDMPLPEPQKRRRTSPQAEERSDGIIRVARERRRGSMMSIVTGLDGRELTEVAKTLKKLCGSGGTAKNGIVEIQGDHREKIVAYFAAQKRPVKKAGG